MAHRRHRGNTEETQIHTDDSIRRICNPVEVTKAIRVRNWSNSVIALVFGLPYKGTKKF